MKLSNFKNSFNLMKANDFYKLEKKLAAAPGMPAEEDNGYEEWLRIVTENPVAIKDAPPQHLPGLIQTVVPIIQGAIQEGQLDAIAPPEEVAKAFRIVFNNLSKIPDVGEGGTVFLKEMLKDLATTTDPYGERPLIGKKPTTPTTPNRMFDNPQEPTGLENIGEPGAQATTPKPNRITELEDSPALVSEPDMTDPTKDTKYLWNSSKKVTKAY